MLTHRNMKTLLACCGIVLVGTATGCNVGYAFPKKHAPRAPVERWSSPSARNGADISVIEVQEVDLVEQLAANRRAYHENLASLREYYEAHGYATKASWAEFELDGLRRVKAFKYLLDAEIASESLRPTDSIAEADALYDRGSALMREGLHGVPAIYRRGKMVEAAGIFRSVIEQYPSSDKIDDAAFMLGEIHKEYLPNQETLAVRWYERAWTWDPNTPHAARFQAAVVYDYRLQDRDRALELYQDVLEKETMIESNVRTAARRIHDLTKDTNARSASRG